MRIIQALLSMTLSQLSQIYKKPLCNQIWEVYCHEISQVDCVAPVDSVAPVSDVNRTETSFVI